MRRVYRRISCLITNSGVVGKRGIRPQESDLGILNDAALVYDEKKGVLWVGPDKELPRTFKAHRQFEGKGLVAYPGLVDCHTHLVFAGDRSREFELRMQGASYQEIAAAGGGILHTMEKTRASSAAELTRLVEQRLKESYGFGVRLLEAKSGYGLNFGAEKKCLEAINRGAENFKKISVEATCLAAHAIPPEFKGNSAGYVKEICEEYLPKLRKLARFCDVFCDPGFFSLDESRTILQRARELGFELRLHGEELANTGAAELAAELGACSVDHLLKISPAGIKALAQSQTIGVLLPTTSFYLREPAAPARRLLEAGVPVAIASDFNPGTSPTQNLPFAGSLAALQLGMTTAEIIAALTYVPARSLKREQEFGALLPGYKGEPVFCRGDHPSSLFYRLAAAGLTTPEPV